MTTPLKPAQPASITGLSVLALGFMMPLIGYVLLPSMGIETFADGLDLQKLLLLFGTLIGGVAYLAYFRFVLSRPQLLVAFIILAWPLVAYFSSLLLDAGVNIHMRPLLILLIALPSLWLMARHGQMLWGQLPWLKYYALFIAWLVLAAIFHNANAVDPRLGGGEEALAEGSVSMVQLTAYFYCLAGMSVTAIATFQARDYRRLFDTFNRALIVVSSLEALAVIVGYPFGLFNLVLDGFTRSIGFFTHPNPFAHHMGILMVYLLGLFCYYQGERQGRLPVWLLLGGLALNFIAFLLGLSKTAIAVFALCAALLFLMNLAVPAVRRSFLNIMIALVVLMPLSLLGFQLLSGQSFFELLESRIDQTQSMSWRTDVWQDLMADIDGAALWLGHGFTAANTTVFRLTFNDARNAQPLMMVHNAYIALLYDLGIMGYLMFASALSLMLNAIRQWLGAVRPMLRTEHSIIMALVVYFLSVCGFDEMSYMFDAPMLFWMLATLLYCVNRREQASGAEDVS